MSKKLIWGIGIGLVVVSALVLFNTEASYLRFIGHTCALTASGRAYCWGSGSFGRLGNGDVETSVVPVEVAGDLAFRQISAGGSHSCGITTSEDVYCWGSNSELQLGSIANNRLQRCGRLPDRCVLEPVLVETDIRFQTVSSSR